MSIQISDCTIRDGGYLTGKNFKPEFINGVIDGLVRAGIDYIETGFLQDEGGGEAIVYGNSKDIRKYIPSFRGKSSFVGFADNSRYSIENLDEYDGKSIESFRIVFAKHECKDALKFASAVKEKGYHVFVQPMDAIGYSDDERKELISEINVIKPGTLAIVDTFGAMHLDDLRMVYEQMDEMLDKDIKIGLHSHNNLHLSCALAEQLIDMAVKTDRSVVIDGSLFGMGRGAGNACTETLVNYLNTKYGMNYDLSVLFDTIEKYIMPLRQTIHWGYDMPMFICGCMSSHVDNVYYLQGQAKCSAKDMYEVISGMDLEKRKRYGTNYSKTDFSEAQKIYNELRSKGNQ